MVYTVETENGAGNESELTRNIREHATNSTDIPATPADGVTLRRVYTIGGGDGATADDKLMG